MGIAGHHSQPRLATVSGELTRHAAVQPRPASRQTGAIPGSVLLTSAHRGNVGDRAVLSTPTARPNQNVDRTGRDRVPAVLATLTQPLTAPPVPPTPPLPSS
jgi:hypothetical protein